ncbi:MAG: hypothetical protein HZA91_01545, partial [Verrucomicrobia bacterium]|nr:hypothetical protein [Verrucomicrobiota bacterium]
MRTHTVAALIVLACIGRAQAAPAELDRYNVVWKTPSQNAAGSMPIGNGEVGLNVWVEEDGDLRFYIARTDAWSEASRLLKLGGVRVSLTPNPFTRGAAFRQELKLRDGRIEIVAGDVRLKVFVDATAPVIHVVGESKQPLGVKAALECWRTEKKVLTGGELGSSWTMQAGPPEIEVWESADVVKDASDAVTWYHRNEHSCVPLTLKHQSLDQFANLVKDPILHRTFGGSITASGFMKDGATALKSSAPMRKFAIRIATHSAVTDALAAWEKQLADIAAPSSGATTVGKATAAWWNAFWDRSWVFVEGDNAAIAALPANQHPLRIGADSNGGSKFRGAMSRATVYQRPLSDEEVASLAAGKPGDAAAVANGRMTGWRFSGPPEGAKVVGAVKFEEQGAVFGGGHIEAPNSPALAFTNSFTLEAWIRPDANSRSARIFDKLTAGKGDGFLFDTHPGRSLRFITGSHSMAVNDVLQPGAWNHVAAVFDAAADGRRLYLNGKLLKAEGGGGTDQPTPSLVTRAYTLQRWMAACAGRGNFPTKFNGSIFTVDPEFTDPKQQFNPDWRRWGDCFWWQNTRFPAWSAVANGDYDLCGPVFRMYRDVLPICKARAKLYYGAEGAYFPETMTSFGTYANRDYGWDRAGKQPGDVACKYWCYAWQQGLELVALMLDCYEHTLSAGEIQGGATLLSPHATNAATRVSPLLAGRGDFRFLNDDLVPMAREVLRYFDTRFQRDAHGKLVISPTQAVETYWFDVVNDTPTVAGLQAVLDRLLALPKDTVPAADRAFWAKMKAAAPPVPLRVEDGKSYVPPAEKFDPKRSNCENPELYAVWPFRLFAVGRPGLETGIETFNRRAAKIMTGWCYDGQCAALLGMTDEAKKQILHKVRNSHRNFRFPAMWGPNFDWLPDQDHGGNILLTLQHMILNADGEKICVLPAWPKDWNLHFKLHAPRRTTVEGRVRNGRLVDLKVTPAERRKDVVVVAASAPPQGGPRVSRGDHPRMAVRDARPTLWAATSS